ncbi:hypothetical protein GCM10019060_27700 [Novosphingobium pokkalii]|nr:hypothetical protein GCM10019060_27700 [Novosphingobium pokkalii]
MRRRAGGFDFLIDPAAPAPDGRALWRADVLASTILVGPAPEGFDASGAITPDDLPAIFAREDGADGVHVTIGQGARRAHLRFEPGLSLWGSVMLPREQALRMRRASADWFLRTRGGASEPSPEGAYLSPSRRMRLGRLLSLFDARRAGATLRQLGARFIDPDLADVSAAAWADASERKQLRRLLATADQLVISAYRRLLRGE